MNKNLFKSKSLIVKRMWLLVLVLMLAVMPVLSGCGQSDEAQDDNSGNKSKTEEQKPDRNGTYDSKDDVKAYLVEYGELPNNYITKEEARDLGWSGGSVERYAKGKCIGGDRFGNYEKQLPKNSDRDFYHECDIDTLGKDSRGAKRIIYAKDGDIYYTDDHYDTFEKIYDAD